MRQKNILNKSYNLHLMNPFNLRIGQGYDIHQLIPGEKLVLGGIEIPSSYSAIGHSDADVLISMNIRCQACSSDLTFLQWIEQTEAHFLSSKSLCTYFYGILSRSSVLPSN
jgi:hypothetical protein